MIPQKTGNGKKLKKETLASTSANCQPLLTLELTKKDEILLVINNVRSNIEEVDTKKPGTDEVAAKLKDELKPDEAVIKTNRVLTPTISRFITLSSP